LSVVNSLKVDGVQAIYAGFPNDQVYTLQSGASNWRTAAGPKIENALFLDTTNFNIYAASQDDTTGVGGVWSGATSGVTASTSVTWSLFGTTNVTAASIVTGFNGLVTGGAPVLFAGTMFTPGKQYANLFKAGSDWAAAADGIVGANVNAILLPSASNVLAGTSGAGIFKTTSGGQ
jgi:hypothetical protein